ncbi:hypothetical protein HKD37_05G013229 [Glycine soja]
MTLKQEIKDGSLLGISPSALKKKNLVSLFVQHQWLPRVAAISRPKCASSRFSTRFFVAIPHPQTNNSEGFLEKSVEVSEKLDNNNNISNHVTRRNSRAS